MNKRVFAFISIYLLKVLVLALMVLPLVMFVSMVGYTTVTGDTPSKDTSFMASVGVAIVMGFTARNWLIGHMPEVDRFYDEEENKKR